MQERFDPLRLLAKRIVDLFPEDAIIITVKHPSRVQKILGKTTAEIPISQRHDSSAWKNALDSLEPPSVFS